MHQTSLQQKCTMWHSVPHPAHAESAGLLEHASSGRRQSCKASSSRRNRQPARKRASNSCAWTVPVSAVADYHRGSQFQPVAGSVSPHEPSLNESRPESLFRPSASEGPSREVVTLVEHARREGTPLNQASRLVLVRNRCMKGLQLGALEAMFFGDRDCAAVGVCYLRSKASAAVAVRRAIKDIILCERLLK